MFLREEIVALRETVRQLQQSQHEREVASAAEFRALRAQLDGAHLSLGRSNDLLTERAYMKCTKIPPFSPNDDRQATAARLAIFDHHLNRLQLSFPVMSRLMSPGYSLLDDDAPEDSVFYRLLYDHTTGAAQDLCRVYHGRGSEAYQAIVSRFKSEDVQAWCHDFAQLRDILKWPAPGVSPANMLSRFCKRHSDFTRRFSVVIPDMLLVALIMEVVPVIYADIRATILSAPSISLEDLVLKVGTIPNPAVSRSQTAFQAVNAVQLSSRSPMRPHDITDSFPSQGRLPSKGVARGSGGRGGGGRGGGQAQLRFNQQRQRDEQRTAIDAKSVCPKCNGHHPFGAPCLKGNAIAAVRFLDEPDEDPSSDHGYYEDCIDVISVPTVWRKISASSSTPLDARVLIPAATSRTICSKWARRIISQAESLSACHLRHRAMIPLAAFLL